MMKATDTKSHNAEKPRSRARVLVISGLYATLMGGAVYFTYKQLIEPTRERSRPPMPTRTDVSSDVLSVALVLVPR